MKEPVRKLTHIPWEGLIAQLASVPSVGIEKVAKEFLQPESVQTLLEPQDIWDLIGGMTGLRQMCANAVVLRIIALCIEGGKPWESAIVSERIRRDAVRLKRAVLAVRLGMAAQILFGRASVNVPFKAQEAASFNYLLRRRVLTLYAANDIERHADLARII
jgi:hypothetical protein